MVVIISDILWLPKVKDSNHTFSKIYNVIRPEYDVRLPMTYDPFAEWLIYAYWNRISPEATLNGAEDREFRAFITNISTEYLNRILLKNKKQDITHIINYHFTTTNVLLIEKRCEALKRLINKQELNHMDRMVLCQIYINIPEGQQRLHQILSKQKNYSFNITNRQIDCAIEKKICAPSCENLQKKGYCGGECDGKR